MSVRMKTASKWASPAQPQVGPANHLSQNQHLPVPNSSAGSMQMKFLMSFYCDVTVIQLFNGTFDRDVKFLEFLMSFYCDVTVVQLFNGTFDGDVIMKKSANMCNVRPSAKGQLFPHQPYIMFVLLSVCQPPIL